MRISKYVSLSEATKSQTAVRKGIDNSPASQEHLDAMVNLATKVFDPVREHFDVPIGVSSFYRSPNLNTAIGGSTRSQHTIGEAMDIDADMFGRLTNKEIYEFIRDNIEFDQMIWEFGTDEEPAWVHVSLKLNGTNRGEMLKAYKENGRTRYTYWH
jgi:hypothetical protein